MGELFESFLSNLDGKKCKNRSIEVFWKNEGRVLRRIIYLDLTYDCLYISERCEYDWKITDSDYTNK